MLDCHYGGSLGQTFISKTIISPDPEKVRPTNLFSRRLTKGPGKGQHENKANTELVEAAWCCHTWFLGCVKSGFFEKLVEILHNQDG